MFRLLIINPGSTSTKIAVYEDINPVFVETLRHSMDELKPYKTIYDQYEFREKTILDTVKNKEIEIDTLDAVVGRGGLLKPIEGGTYEVNEAMLTDLKLGVQGQHASNLGGILAYNIGKTIGKPAYIVDPVVVDELEEVARFSGMPEIRRRSVFHALNQKAVARRYAKEKGKRYEDVNVIVAHMGGGISIGCHKNGKVVDVNNALDGEGPFSPDRSGTLPVGDLIKICYSGKYTYEEVKGMIVGKGGLMAYLNTTDAREIEKMIDGGDKGAERIFYAMAYQVAKQIGMSAAVLKGQVDAVVLTGGLAYSKRFVNAIEERVSFIAPVKVYPGEDEMLALTEGGLRVLKGEEKANEYK